MSGKNIFILLFFLLALLTSCQKEKTANVSFSFAFQIDGQPMQQDVHQYVNTARNLYEVNEAMFFISDMTFYKNDGSVISKGTVHYVDVDIPSTLSWNLGAIPQGDYSAISFTFGMADAQNQSFRFVNPPECDMSWPAVLGGGYHYMKINGKWLADDGQVKPFNLHTGRGQIYDNEGNIIQIIDNSFMVKLNDYFTLKKDGKNFQLCMDINQWFNASRIFDLNEWGGSIMQNQEAQEILKQNGPYVFKLKEK